MRPPTDQYSWNGKHLKFDVAKVRATVNPLLAASLRTISASWSHHLTQNTGTHQLCTILSTPEHHNIDFQQVWNDGLQLTKTSEMRRWFWTSACTHHLIPQHVDTHPEKLTSRQWWNSSVNTVPARRKRTECLRNCGFASHSYISLSHSIRPELLYQPNVAICCLQAILTETPRIIPKTLISCLRNCDAASISTCKNYGTFAYIQLYLIAATLHTFRTHQ